jgi:hypothetical protein
MRRPGTLGALVFVSLLVAAATASAQDRLAQLTKVSGTVKITRSADGTVDEARQAGPRVLNGSVFGGDVVSTTAGAEATLAFSDGSSVALNESTSLTVQELDRSKLVGSGGIEKPIGRRIKILAGKILADVVPSTTVATEFETPSGVAAVKGTRLVIEVQPEGTL